MSQNAEAPRFPRDGEIVIDICRELDEDAVVAPSLVQLSGGMEEARAVACGRGDVKVASDRSADLLNHLVALRRLGEVLGDGDVVTGLDALEKLDHRLLRRRRLAKGQVVLSKLAAGAILLEQLLGVVLRFLHVRLVEG